MDFQKYRKAIKMAVNFGQIAKLITHIERLVEVQVVDPNDW